MLRRVAPRVASPKNTTIVRGDITIDVGRRAVKLNESPVPLTATEFDLLLLLAQNPGRTFTRDELVTTLWGAVRASSSGSLGVHMAHLRAKLNDDTTKPRYIITVWGVGYYFDGNV